jgi:predicted  nucleic acid-binding Zn-ribbon protein
MWSNISSFQNVVGAAIQKVQSIQHEIENQMDQAVGAKTSSNLSSSRDEDTKNEDSASVPHISEKEDNETLLDSNSVAVAATVVKFDDESSEGLAVREKKARYSPVSEATTPVSVTKEPKSKVNESRDATLHDTNFFSEILSSQNDVLPTESFQETVESLPATSALDEDIVPSTSNGTVSNGLKKQGDSGNTTMDTSAISLLQDENSALKRDKSKQLEELNQLKSSLKKLEKQNKSLQSRNTDLDQNVSRLNEEKSKDKEVLKKELDDRKKEQEQFRKEKEERRKEQEEHRNQLIERNTEKPVQDGVVDNSVEVSSLKSEVTKLNEIVKERERALETSTIRNAELLKQYEDLQRKCNDLTTELEEKNQQTRKIQSSMIDENDLKKELRKLQDSLKEKEEKLLAFESEGNKLAKKQSEMEKSVRKAKADVKERETEILKLKESKDQLMKALEQTQETLKKVENENNNISKTLNAMNTVSQASSDKLTKLENELSSKMDELTSQRKALENAWSDNSDLKRTIVELKADRDDLRRQIGEGTIKVMESESFRREIEQREAILKATSLQFQENLRNQMNESAHREERLREEVSELRKKWQDAISSREKLSSELSSATTPLLRQISSLQETLRIRTEQWQTVESQLTERVLRAENINETFESKRSYMEDQITSLKQQLTILQQKHSETKQTLSSLQSELEKVKKNENTLQEERDEYEKKWNEENSLRQTSLNNVREMELKCKLELQEKAELYFREINEKEKEIQRLTKELEKMNNLEQNNNDSNNMNGNANHSHHQHYGFNGKDRVSPISASTPATSEYQSVKLPSMNLPSECLCSLILLSLFLLILPCVDGEYSFVASEKLHQKTIQRDEEIRGLQVQIHQLQVCVLCTSLFSSPIFSFSDIKKCFIRRS